MLLIKSYPVSWGDLAHWHRKSCPWFDPSVLALILTQSPLSGLQEMGLISLLQWRSGNVVEDSCQASVRQQGMDAVSIWTEGSPIAGHWEEVEWVHMLCWCVWTLFKVSKAHGVGTFLLGINDLGFSLLTNLRPQSMYNQDATFTSDTLHLSLAGFCTAFTS